MFAAGLRFSEAHKAAVLRDQVERRQLAHSIRDFCREATSEIAILSDEERSDATSWIDWSVRYANQIDPLRQPLSVPEDPEPKPEDLKPYLKGWSPYGPWY